MKRKDHKETLFIQLLQLFGSTEYPHIIVQINLHIATFVKILTFFARVYGDRIKTIFDK